MKSIEMLEKQYQKEKELSEKHKQKATDIKKEIDLLKGNMTVKAINALNLNGAQYDQLMKLLKNKKSVLEAVEIICGKGPEQPEESGGREFESEENE